MLLLQGCPLDPWLGKEETLHAAWYSQKIIKIIYKEREDTDRKETGGGWVKVKAEIGVMQLQTKAWDRFFLRASRRNQVCQHVHFGLPAS